MNMEPLVFIDNLGRMLSVVVGIAVILCDFHFRNSVVVYLCQWCKTMTGQSLDCTATDLPHVDEN